MSQESQLQALQNSLEQRLGATGKTWSEIVSSLEKVLPAVLVKQLLALPQLEGELFSKSLESCQNQLALFARVEKPVQSEEIWDETRRAEARAKIDAAGNVITKLKRQTLTSRLAWWLHDTRANIPKRAYRISRTWRLPMTLVFAMGGAILGWFSVGLGAAVLGAVVVGVIGFVSYAEQNIAKSLWWQTRLLEEMLKLFRGLFWLVLVLLGLGLVALLVWFVLRNWNTR